MPMTDNSGKYKPLIVAFCCNWCSYAGADLAGSNRLGYPADVKIIRVPCSCRVNPMFILRAFQRGADGVIICGCHPGDCHYTSGNYYTRRRMALLFSMLDYLGIERERTRVEWVSAAEGAKFAATMNDFAEKVAGLGKNKRLEVFHAWHEFSSHYNTLSSYAENRKWQTHYSETNSAHTVLFTEKATDAVDIQYIICYYNSRK